MKCRHLTVRNRILIALVVAFLLCASFVFCFAFGGKTAVAEGEHSHATRYSQAGGTLSSGSYYLEMSITVTAPIVIPDETVVNFCLNGKNLTASFGTGANGTVFVVQSGGVLNLYDEGDGYISGGRGTSQTVEGVSSSKGGGIYVAGTLNMYGGEISGNSASYGAGVEVEGGTFNMYGGKISDNTATSEGGGVNVSADGTFNMISGEISGNSAGINGGGVYVCAYGGSGKFYMTGGSITGNTAAYGGGVYMTDTESVLSVSGAVDITGNKTSGGIANNIYLGTTSGAAAHSVLTIGGALTGAHIGITLENGYSGAFTTGYGTANGSVDPGDIFIYDDISRYCSRYGSGTSSEVTTGAASVIELGLSNIAQWKTSGADLGSGNIYEYENGVMSASKRSDLESSGVGLSEVRRVTSSIASRTGGAVTVELNIQQGVNYTAGEYTGNSKTDEGKYSASVTLTAATGYYFTYPTALDASYGITVTLGVGGKTAEIIKTWYILSSANILLDSAESTGGVEAVFNVEGWTFGGSVALNMPRAKNDNYVDGSGLTFSLKKGESAIAESHDIADLSDYINSSMPADTYTLEIDVPEVGAVTGTNWWGGTEALAASDGFVARYTFTVAPAKLVLGLTSDADTGYLDYEWNYVTNADKTQFFAEFEDELEKSGALTFKTVTPQGYWADRAEYYGGYDVTYNFARIYDNDYYASNDGKITNAIGGGENGTYKVFFRINAKNHEILPDAADKYDYFFTVTVYQEVEVPTIDDVNYIGVRAVPVINGNGIFDVVYDASDDYITGGTHYIKLELRDDMHYRWAESTEYTAVDGSVTLSYEIRPVTNTWLRTPNIVGWEFGSYTPESNAIIAIPTYGSAEYVKLSVAMDELGDELVEGLESFTTDSDGNVSDTVKELLENLGYGTYWLIAEVPSSANYTALPKQSASFTITKTVNYWTKPLSVVAWSDGAYSAKTNVITAEAHVGTVKIVIVDAKSGKEYYNSATGLNDLKNAPVGLYRLSATVDASESYGALSDAVEFRVFEAAKEGFPWWAVLLIVLGVVLIVVLILFILYKKGIFQLVSEKMVVAIRTRADTDATIAAVRAGKIAAEAAIAEDIARAAAAQREAEEAAIDAASDEEEAEPEYEDDEDNMAYEPDDNEVEVPSSAGFEKVFAASSGEQITYGKTVLSKLISAPDIVKTRYSELKNYLLGFKKARANMSRSRESYYLGRKCFARIAVRGKTMCLYLALNPADCDEKYRVEDVLSVKSYVDTPCLLRIRSERALRYAKELVDGLMESIGGVKIDRKPENYAELFRNIEMLEKKNLLSYGVKKKKTNNNNFGKGDN